MYNRALGRGAAEAGGHAGEILIFSLVAAVLPGAGALLSRLDGYSPLAIKEALTALDHWGVLASVGLMVAHSFVPFPAELLACANGMVYGPLWGTLITWVGAMLGACAAFALARRLGRSTISRLVPRRHRRALDRWLARDGWQLFFVGRFIPVIAFNLLNYAAGLTRLSWWTFVWTTGVGILPMTLLMVLLGDNFLRVPEWAWLGVLGMGVLLWAVIRALRRA